MRQRFAFLALSILALSGVGVDDTGWPKCHAEQPVLNLGGKHSSFDCAALQIDPARPASSAFAINEALKTRLYDPMVGSDRTSKRAPADIESDIDTLACLLGSLA